MKLRSLSTSAQLSLGGAILLVALCAVFALFAASVQEPVAPPPLDTGTKVQTLLDTEQGKTMLLKNANEVFAANYFPTLLGAKGDGIADDTAPVKLALELAKQTGGTVYLPRGVYRITEPLILPAGVTLRGEFSSPDAVSNDRTVLMAGDNEILRKDPLITLEDTANLVGITLYYEKQTPEAVIAYPASVYCTGTATVQSLALINPYHGICITGSGDVTVQGVWMSPLDYGILITENDASAYLENISVSPTYWLNTVPDRFAEKGTYEILTRYLHEHLHGMILEKVADVALNRYNVESAYVGLLLNVPAESDGLLLATELSVTSTNRPLYLQSLPACGVSFSNSTFRPTGDTGSDTVALSEGATAPVIFAGCTFAGTPKSVVHVHNPSFLSFYHCDFGTWWNTCFDLSDSTFLAVAPTFRTHEDKAALGKNAFGLLYGGEGDEDAAELLFAVSKDDAKPSAFERIFALSDASRVLPTEIINGLDYGMSKEAANNSEALKKAVDAALQKKALLFIPEGEYNFTEAILLPKNLHLTGVGHTGTYKTTFTFHSAANGEGCMIRLEEGASLENLEVLQAWNGSDLYAVACSASNAVIRNLSIRAPRGIFLEKGEKITVEQVNLQASAQGIFLQKADANLRRITLTDPAANGKGILCADGRVTLSGITAKSLSNALTATGTAQVTGTLLSLEDVATGIITADSAQVTLSALGVSGRGTAASAFLYNGGGSLTVQGMICRGADQGNVLYSAAGNTVLAASLFSAEMPVTLQSAGGETNVMGCVWNKTPAFHAAATAGTVTLNGNLLPASAVFEGIEGNYLTVSATESGEIEDGVNVMDFTYVEGEEDAESGSGASDAQTNKPPLE